MSFVRARNKKIHLDSTAIMGILNLNENSFSDPGPRTELGVINQAVSLASDGASIIDIGAQSSITRRLPIPPDVEIAAVIPILRKVVAELPDVAISVDTFKPAVAEAALSEGADIINDVSGLRDVRIAQHCARHGAGLVIMHTSAAPLVRMQEPDLYHDVIEEVATFLTQRRDMAVQLGVDINSIIVDPGVDFAKTPAQSIELLRGLEKISKLGHPLLLALSRKDFVGALIRKPPRERLAGTLGAIAALRHLPSQILRVHDARETIDMITVLDTLTGAIQPPSDLKLDEEMRHQRSDV